MALAKTNTDDVPYKWNSILRIADIYGVTFSRMQDAAGCEFSILQVWISDIEVLFRFHVLTMT